MYVYVLYTEKAKNIAPIEVESVNFTKRVKIFSIETDRVNPI